MNHFSQIIKNKDIELSNEPYNINPYPNNYRKNQDQINIIKKDGIIEQIEITCGSCRKKISLEPLYKNQNYK